MDVHLVEERMLLLQDRFTMDIAEGRAWARRMDAFGTFKKLTGLLTRPRDEDFEVVYRERRLQPFWRIACSATLTYQRARKFAIAVDGNVTAVDLAGTSHPVTARSFELEGVEHCHDEIHRETCYDAVSGAPDPRLAEYLRHDAQVIEAEALLAEAGDRVIVPPQAKASTLVREMIAGSIARIEADSVQEERLEIGNIDLYYRPVYAFRFRWQGKEAVVECDGVTGVARTGGTTFEHYVGKVMDPHFLVNFGVEAAQLVIPGARIAEIVISKTIEISRDTRKR